jgi:predicted MFS family arabinose efflux permease
MSNSFHVPQVSRGQAYAMLGGAALMMTLAMGIRQNLGLFQAPAARELGIAISDFALAISVQQVAWGVSQPFVGILADKYGTRWVSLIGSLIYIVGVVLTATATSQWPIVLGAGRDDRRGAVLHQHGHHRQHRRAGRGAAPPHPGLRHRLGRGIGRHHVHGADRRLISSPTRAGAPGLWGLRDPRLGHAARRLHRQPSRPLPNSRVADRNLTLLSASTEARRHSGYVVMSLAFFVCGLQLVFITTHLPTYLAQCGVDPSYSALMLMLVGGFNILSSWLFGWLGDRYPKRLLLGGIYLLRSAAIAAFFLHPPTPLSIVLFGRRHGHPRGWASSRWSTGWSCSSSACASCRP